MSIEVNVNDYVFAHGHRPRGRGYWAFFFKRHDDVANAFWHTGTYAEAKKAAVAEARRRNAPTVFVGS